MNSFNMGFSVHWSWLVALSCILCMGGEVLCNCTETNIQIEGGDYKLTKQLKTGSLLIYNCPEGQYPHPALTRLCQPNGIWRPAPRRFSPQRCRPVECPDPNVLESGHVSPPQERYLVDNETTYECYSGHTMRGSSRRVCLPNGKWSGSTPICSQDNTAGDCASPGVPAGASRTGNSFGIGERVKYSCNENLFLVGSSERVCQESGQWTGKEPACYYRHTYDTAMEVSESFGRTMKDRLIISAPVDDRQEGRRIRISKGKLNIYIAMDVSERIYEGDFRKSREAVITLIRKISSFSVNPNYEIVFFSCDIVEIVNISDSRAGQVGIATIISKLNNFERSDDISLGVDLNSVFWKFLEQMSVMKQEVGEEAFKEHRHVIIVFTDGGYNVGEPAPTVAKIKDMVYMDSDLREEYLDIYIFGIGDVILENDLQALTTGTGGRHYFRMRNIANLQETFDEIIDEEEVRGLCGLHREYETRDRYSDREMYPWVAFIIIQNDGQQRRCTGSLVTPQFVLTAANCFTFGDLPEHVTVEIDDGQGRVKRVKAFFVHQNYNVHAKRNEGVSEFYDYDVALIQLQQDVHFSTVVRPICIPCTRETSDALKLASDSTCREQEQLLLRRDLERLSFLTKTGITFAEKNVHAKLGDNRDACIRHALQAPGITTDDPKKAVTDNFLCTGGRSPHRDHIACPGDSGGAVFKNFEHRTIQVAVVSWGTKRLCHGGGIVESDETSRDFHLNLFRVVPFLRSVLGNDNQDDYTPLQFLTS